MERFAKKDFEGIVTSGNMYDILYESPSSFSIRSDDGLITSVPKSYFICGSEKCYFKNKLWLSKLFDGILDKGGSPYINHLEFVEQRALELNIILSLESTIEDVALNHDTLEDIDCVSIADMLDRYNQDIVNRVLILTRKSGVTYEDYIKEVGSDYITTVVKLADLEHNMNITRLKKLTSSDVKRLQKYLKSYLYLKEKYEDFQIKFTYGKTTR